MYDWYDVEVTEIQFDNFLNWFNDYYVDSHFPSDSINIKDRYENIIAYKYSSFDDVQYYIRYTRKV